MASGVITRAGVCGQALVTLSLGVAFRGGAASCLMGGGLAA